MKYYDYVVMGGAGLVGSSFIRELKSRGLKVLSLTSRNFYEYKSKNISTKVFINANGNNFRFKANKKPFWDFDKSVYSLLESLRGFNTEKYIYFSSIDVYNDKSNPFNNQEDTVIDLSKLDYYAFHKALAESLLKKYHSDWLIFRLGTVVSANAKKGPFYDLNQKRLFIDQDSTLSIIDIENIHLAVSAIEKNNISNEIFNLTGTGNVKIKDLIEKYNISIELKNDTDGNDFYAYEISNTKIKTFADIDSAITISERYFN